ncbi:glycosyltransferase [Hydrogenophaga electricum]|uniref:glycosyltransferase n=1 Tax=Hydrogenophaga electricum TaxID=1230953 RepID=UPI0024E189EE|nr:glycosyltransferase [Hydrogenophaga electricum]
MPSSPRNILFIHQNFPGQFRHLAPALVERGDQVVALGILGQPAVRNWNGVRVLSYQPRRSNTAGLHPWLVDMETKLIRGEACWQAMRSLQAQGFRPDLVMAHPGWGEPLFAKQVWPGSPLAIYAEFFYQAEGADMGFDPEFAPPDAQAERCRLQMKNLNHLAHLEQASAAISPTHWQASTFPAYWRDRIEVCHDGIDTDAIRPDLQACFPLPAGQVLTRDDEVVTYVARHLEPYRGFHVFMRLLPELLRARPHAHIVIVGDDGKGYGADAGAGQSWRQRLTQEIDSQMPVGGWRRVHFISRLPRDAFTRLLQITRLHCYLTYPFVLSWSLLEAMSAGACILASDTAPVREVIQNGQQGILVDFFDRHAWLAQAVALLEQPETRQALSASARQRAVAHYDLRTVSLSRQLAWVSRHCADSHQWG